jgi:hypothetical protein
MKLIRFLSKDFLVIGKNGHIDRQTDIKSLYGSL